MSNKAVSHFKIFSLILIANLVLALSAYAQNQEQLPAGVKKLIYAEQKLLSRDVNERRIMTPKANFQETKYMPENSQIFEVKSYWVNADSVAYFQSQFASKKMKQMFSKTESNQDKVLMLVHPESESMFKDFLAGVEAGPRFWATSTASSRTLLMWPDTRPQDAFFGKLSLNKEIGGVVRTIPQGEVARSLGTNEILYANKQILPNSFRFMPETISMIPHGFNRGGMIIREIPADLASGKSDFIPLFSLYADRGDQMPLLAEMINKSGLSYSDFIESQIIGPFVKQWAEMVITHGISMEPHAQNVLIGLNGDGLPNGQFMHRDFGGFNMDIENFKLLKTKIAPKLPVVTSLEEDYHQKHVKSSINQALETYFDQGFVYNLDQKLPLWIEKGWVAGDGQKHSFSRLIYTNMAKEFARLTQGKVQPTADEMHAAGLEVWIEKARPYLPASTGSKLMLCERIFL